MRSLSRLANLILQDNQPYSYSRLLDLMAERSDRVPLILTSPCRFIHEVAWHPIKPPSWPDAAAETDGSSANESVALSPLSSYYCHTSSVAVTADSSCVGSDQKSRALIAKKSSLNFAHVIAQNFARARDDKRTSGVRMLLKADRWWQYTCRKYIFELGRRELLKLVMIFMTTYQKLQKTYEKKQIQ